MSVEDSEGEHAFVKAEESFSSYIDSDASSQDQSSSLHENNDVEMAEGNSDPSLMIIEGGHTSHAKSMVAAPKGLNLGKIVKKHQDDYIDLYNTVVLDATGQDVSNLGDASEPPSQIGASAWTSLEKELFFRNIPTLGRDNINGIAAAIGSKSEFEVHQYIQLLSAGAIEGVLTHTLDSLFTTDIPAATEISEACEDILDAAADELRKNQLHLEKKRELKKHGDYWILNEDVAEAIDEMRSATAQAEAVNSPIPDREEVGGIVVHEIKQNGYSPVPAADLLNLRNWLELSRHFMWQSQDGSDNWTDYVTSKDETPSLYHTAFSDFHNVAVSLTRRLLQTSIFQAQSRIRNDDRNPDMAVQSNDVRAAAHILRLDHNKRKFWGTMPRRHNLKVYVREGRTERNQSHEEQAKQGQDYRDLRYVSYDELETKLGVVTEREADTVAGDDDNAMSSVEDLAGPLSIYDDSDMWTEVSVSDGGGDGDSDTELQDRTFQASGRETSPGPRSGHGSATRKKQDLDKQLDAQAEMFDQRASALEEAKLWELFNLPPPTRVKSEDTALPLPSALHPKRKVKADFKDWRQATDFRAEWERSTGRAENEDFVAMHRRGETNRKKRRLEHSVRAPLRRLHVSHSRTGAEQGYQTADDDDDDEEAEDAEGEEGMDEDGEVRDEEPRAPSPAEYHTIPFPIDALASTEHQHPPAGEAEQQPEEGFMADLQRVMRAARGKKRSKEEGRRAE